MLTSDLQYAQDTAITTQEPITVTFDTGTDSYTLSNESGPLIHPMTKLAYVTSYAAMRGFGNVNLVSAAFGGNNADVTFDELGAPDNAGTVVLQAGNQTYRVLVAVATGRVTVQAGP